MATMLYQGHGSFRITLNDGKVVYVDPFAGEGYDLPADVILVTHEHGDHNQVDKMPHAEGCAILRAKDFLPSAGEHKTISTHGISITAVQAQNKNHPVDQCVGLVMDLDGIRFYAAGDTSETEDMRSGKIAAMEVDYATFPGDGFYNMSVEAAAHCAQLVRAKHSIPIHLVPVHDMGNPTLFDRSVAERFSVDQRLIVEPGQTIELI